jgi:hypothetical protein
MPTSGWTQPRSLPNQSILARIDDDRVIIRSGGLFGIMHEPNSTQMIVAANSLYPPICFPRAASTLLSGDCLFGIATL